MKSIRWIYRGISSNNYKQGESLPEYMEKARGLALHGNYAFIEVYENACRAVSEDGSVAVIMDEA